MSGESDVRLRAVALADIELFFEHQLDPVAGQMAAFPSRDHETHLVHWRKILADDEKVAMTILVGDDVAGNMVSWSQDGQREVGYWLGRRFWRRGIATAALEQFLEVVTQRPLHAWVADHNVGSIRVLEKCGFVRADHQPMPAPGEVSFTVFELTSPVR